MPLYECVFIARQDVPSSQVEALTESYSGIIAEGGGNVTKTEYWGLKNLNYRIKKNRKGHYVLMNVDAPYPAVAEMERQMGLNEDVLRNLTIRVDALEEGPSAMMQSRGRDGDRDRRGDRGFRGDRGDRGDRGERSDRGDRGDRGERSDRETRQSKGDEE
ncbi:MAG TPA: 30S ribosomal protein S6 [Alphaproteobacteria bacterium]|nr:30S ribosomal protein S6 [Alphaproteobacteria bacterium]